MPVLTNARSDLLYNVGQGVMTLGPRVRGQRDCKNVQSSATCFLLSPSAVLPEGPFSATWGIVLAPVWLFGSLVFFAYRMSAVSVGSSGEYPSCMTCSNQA